MKEIERTVRKLLEGLRAPPVAAEEPVRPVATGILFPALVEEPVRDPLTPVAAGRLAVVGEAGSSV